MEFQDHTIHSGNISRIRVSYDNHYLFSTSDDGSLYISKLTDRDCTLKRLEDYSFANEILVTKSDIDEKINMVAELQSRTEELRLENASHIDSSIILLISIYL